jgi:hypothetical protein
MSRVPSTISEDSSESTDSGSIFTDVGHPEVAKSPVPATVDNALTLLAVAAETINDGSMPSITGASVITTPVSE